MSSSISSAQNGQASGGGFSSFWTTYVKPVVVPPAAASVAIVPAFWLFMVKSAHQQGKEAPKIAVSMALKEGLKAAPTIGAIVGTQVIGQTLMEKYLMGLSEGETASLPQMALSTTVIGGISVPFLAVFNGRSMQLSAKESIKNLSMKQAGLIVGREITFLGAMRVSGPMSDYMQEQFGKNDAVKYSAAFVSGVVGSLFGQMPDTAFTRAQKGLPFEGVAKLWRGAPARALALGVFTASFKFAQDTLNSKV